MAKQKPILTMMYDIFTMEKAERFITASKVLDLTGGELIDKALDEYLTNRNL